MRKPHGVVFGMLVETDDTLPKGAILLVPAGLDTYIGDGPRQDIHIVRVEGTMKEPGVPEPLEFTNRYEALGLPLPDPETMCTGQCEGTGWVPTYMRKGDMRAIAPDSTGIVGRDVTDPRLIKAWEAAEAVTPAEDGWHFLQCPECHGTGLKPPA